MTTVNSVLAQETVQKFRAYHYFNETTAEVVQNNGEHNWKDCNVLIVLGNDKIKIYTNNYAELDIVKVTNRTEDNDVITYDEKAVDKLGNDVDVDIAIFKHGMNEGYQAANLIIYYPTFIVQYQLWYD